MFCFYTIGHFSIAGNVVPKGEKKKSKKSLAPKENNDIDPIDVV